MSRKDKRRKEAREERESRITLGLAQETKNGIWGILLILKEEILFLLEIITSGHGFLVKIAAA